MRSRLIRKEVIAVGLLFLTLAAAGDGRAGLTPQGLTPQGLTPQGMTLQGLTPQGLTPQGLTPQGLTSAGVVLQGTDVVAAELKGTIIGSVDIRGTDLSSPIAGHTLTTGPLMSSGPGDYISVGSDTAVGHFAVAHLLDAAKNPAEDIDLFIADVHADSIPNEFHRADAQHNDVWLYVVYYFHKWSGQWYSLCPFNPLTGDASAMAIPEDAANPNKFIFACTASGVASKCARNWGYRPWQKTKAFDFDGTDWVEKSFDLRDYYNVCKIAARAGYCQDDKSFTRAGTLVDLFDTRQIIWPNAIENPFDRSNPDSLWMMSQEYFVSLFDHATGPVTMQASALQRTRWRELSPVGDCADIAEIDRLEHDHFEDGRWANPLTATPRFQVFSPNYCTHKENVEGEGLPWDCSPCTKAVCRSNPTCCTTSAGSPGWTSACVATHLEVCQDVLGADCSDAPGASRPCWPLGRVWPDDVPQEEVRPGKVLLSAGGAVERVEGVSTGSSAATVIGWACDAEWPGASVAVDLYGGAPRGQAGSVLLGRAYADLALASPLALEVSTACDGIDLTTARHGFSFTLPTGQTGNVFAYAVDATTPDGPGAPPVLLRNGIVHVPTCAHSEHVTGAALDSSCSTCAASVCAKGGLSDCCSVSWTDSCTAAAESCSATATSAAADTYAFAVATTGWVEAPATGTFTFQSATQPSRLFINGKKVFDWWDGPGTTQGTIDLVRGAKYNLRWDRFQSAPDPSSVSPGLTWQPPGSIGQSAVPASLLYKVAPGLGTGLLGQYVPTAGLPFTNVDAAIDFGTKSPVPDGATAPFDVTWSGDVVAPVSDSYTFIVVGDGGPTLTLDGSPVLLPDPPANNKSPGCSALHDVCDIGVKLAASTLTVPACDPCVDLICNPASPTADPFCCNGGYLSYYSSEPEWDAKCVAEVGSICHIDCSRPPPNPIGTQHKTAGIPLQAGVRHHVTLSFTGVASTTATMQLLWQSPTQNKQVIPTMLLYPNTPAGRGAGLNAVYCGTKETAGVRVADLDTLLASTSVPDLSTTASTGPSGLPQIEVLAAPDDASLAKPPRPAVVSPAFNGHAVGAGASFAVTVSGIGGVHGGSVMVSVDGLATPPVEIDVDGNGNFSGSVPTGGAGPGPRVMHLTQRTYTGASCAAPAVCAVSKDMKWDFNVDSDNPATAPAPTIVTPRDPTASLDPTITNFLVVGHGVPNVQLDIVDQGGLGHTFSPDHLPVGADGNFSGTVTLSPGTTSDANPGWHKLGFSQGGGAVTHVFVSVGIRPPTVEFPRSDAEIDCKKANQNIVEVKGNFPYDQTSFGRLVFTEETGTSTIRVVPSRDTTVGQPVTNPDGTQSFPFDAHALVLQPGKHLIYAFQLPPIPANATPEEARAHVRGFAAIAHTPRSDVEITVPPPTPVTGFRQGTIILKPPGDLDLGPPIPVPGQITPCGPNATAPDERCALPFADVNIHIGPRLFTVRADRDGAWHYRATFPLGFSDLSLTQVVDSPVGGGWSESCPSDVIGVGLPSDGTAPMPIVPGPLTFDAVSPAGRPVSYNVGVNPNGFTSVQVLCTPASGSTFPIGLTAVHCEAVDNVTKATGLAAFTVTIVDQAPIVNVPAAGITAEATFSLGAMVSYDITATDVVDGPLPVTCAPSAPPGSPALFLLDQDTTVSCQATDSAFQTTTETFVVRVRDTTPPVLCDLPNIKVNATGPNGAIVTYATCASDVVDGAVPVVCNRPSGSLFPVGTTQVTCSATDKHGNRSPDARFFVSVGDTTPPVLKLPGTITVTANRRNGARVTYTVTATDNVDPHPVVACAPPSGSIFPLGTTVVHCTATDASGNQSHGSFKVRVIVSWSGFLFPIIDDSSKFLRPVPIPVRFHLTGASEDIDDLPAFLFIARLDAAGNPGPERPADGLPPVLGNQFRQLPPFDVYSLLMKTLTMQTGRWQLRVDLGDGEVHTARITLF